MQIKELEVAGFKSFVDRVKLSFKPGITALVGPNGCGKSNVIDAMRWIMGEHNARQLRGTKMEDLIFNGSETRKPTGMAEVSMILSNGNGNGNGKSLLNSASEIMLTRRLFRSGESEYLINKVPCRLKDIVEIFLDSGVGTKSYSIMEQGKVDFILSLKPDERRILIEEAAGISKYRVRKKEALSKMESTKNNLLRLKDVLNELQLQMRGLSLQVKRLKRHENIKEEIKKIDLMMASSRMQALADSKSGYQSQLSDYRDEEIQISTKKNSSEAALETERFNLTEIHKKIDQLSQDCYEAREDIQNEESSIKLNEQDMNSTYDLIEKTGRTLCELENELTNADSEILKKENELSIINSEIEDMQNSVNTASDNLLMSKNSLKEVQDTIEKEKSELFNVAHEISEIKNSVSMNKRLQEELKLKLQKIKEERKSCDKTFSELEQNKSLLEKEIKESSAIKEQKSVKIDELRITISNLSEALLVKDSSLNEMKDRIGLVNARLESLRELQSRLEGFDKGVRTIVTGKNQPSSGLNGIAGLFADVIETEPEYEHIVEAVLGMKLQSIIVETHEDGFRAIEHLKLHSSGRVTFIPLTLMQKTGDGFNVQNAVPLVSVVRTDNSYQKVINVLLGDVLLVENITQALEIWNSNRSKYTIVTKECEIIEPEGIITGGSSNGSGSGILKRNREIKEFTEELKQIESRFQVIKTEREELHKQLQNDKQFFEELVEEKQVLDNRLFQLKTNFEQTEKELLLEKGKIDLLCFEESECLDSLNKHGIEIEHLLADESVKQETEEKKRQQIRELQNNEEQLKEKLEKCEIIYTDYRIKLASSQQKQENISDNLNTLSANKKLFQSKADTLKHEIESMEKKTETLSVEIENSKELLKVLINKNRELELQIDDQRRKSHSIENAVKTSDLSLKELMARWEVIEPEIHELDLKISEIAIHQEHLKKDVLEKYAISMDQLPPPPDPESFNEEESKERIEKLNKRLENIGAVNLGAATEYEEIEKRFRFLSSQEEDLLQSINSLQKVITKINSITKKRFSETYNSINSHFQELFPMLFNGGKAYMKLTDESDLLETGIDIFAQPPGKKLQSLDLLSGGERALTVIALMFAIFLTKPSPFCVMDEIDAPLDDSNIGRFITHLRKMAERSQFIIITHNKLSMQAANSLYGITMQERGVSKIVSVELN